MVTDTGTPTYDAGPARQRARSTAAHNTLQIDGAEQIECWGSFRVGRRGRARVHGLGEDGRWSWLAASHDGWRRLPGRPLHRRLLALSETSLLVLDLVTGRGQHRLRSTLHRHPDLAARRAAIFALAARAGRLAAPLHERFNDERESTELYVEAEGPLPWLGGWIVVFGEGAGAPAVELHVRDGAAIARCPTPGLEFEVRWKPGAATARDSVQITSCPASAPSAT